MDSKDMKTETMNTTRNLDGRQTPVPAKPVIFPEFLQKQPKKTLRVPKDAGDLPVCVNGFTVILQAGADVEVPEEIHTQASAYLASIDR